MSIRGYGNILRVYSLLQSLEQTPGFSLEHLCSYTNWSYDEIRHFITFCDKIKNEEINVSVLKDYTDEYVAKANELIELLNNLKLK